MLTYKNQILVTLMLSILIGCSDGSIEPEPIETVDRISGIFFLHGSRTTTEAPCFHCPAGEDTLRETITFSVITRLDPQDPERIQFFGLQGADTGDVDKRVYPDCTRSADCEIFGSVHSEVFFEIDIDNNGHHYQASGYIGTEDIDLQGQYSYDGVVIEYDLSGKRVSLTLEN